MSRKTWRNGGHAKLLCIAMGGGRSGKHGMERVNNHKVHWLRRSRCTRYHQMSHDVPVLRKDARFTSFHTIQSHTLAYHDHAMLVFKVTCVPATVPLCSLAIFSFCLNFCKFHGSRLAVRWSLMPLSISAAKKARKSTESPRGPAGSGASVCERHSHSEHPQTVASDHLSEWF